MEKIMSLNRQNSSLQKRHLNKAKSQRLLDVTDRPKFKENPKFEKAKKAFQHMPNYN